MQDVIDKAQNAAKSLEDEFQATLSSIKEAVQSSKQQGVIDALNEQLGATYSMLAAVQSAAFADAMKILKDEQKHHAARVYDTLGLVRISGERPGRLRSGPKGVV